jgi:hypothetical protein
MIASDILEVSIPFDEVLINEQIQKFDCDIPCYKQETLDSFKV